MQITASLPFDDIAHGQEFLAPEAIGIVGRALEKAGFYGGSVTDHPCPTGRWLEGGGHYAQDPFVLLSLLAASTTTLRLFTGILVLPYRNPFITARAASSLDVFSGGRLSLGLGAGYMKAEYKALGVDFDSRNEIFDEYLLAMKTAWGSEEFTFQGTGYEALGNRILPHPVQKPHPMLLVGGNSRRAIRRAVELADAWYPFFTPAAVSSTARTAAMADEEDLATGVAYMREHAEKVGKPVPKLFLGSSNRPGDPWEPQQIIDKLSAYRELGAFGSNASISGSTRTEYCDNAQRFGEEVIAKL